MADIAILSKTYRPSMNVGQVYARPYGSNVSHMPIGNVLELSLEHSEDVQTQEDMTQLGGGIHAEVRRVKEVKVKMKLADLNLTNLARASLGTVAGVESGTATKEAFRAVPSDHARTAAAGVCQHWRSAPEGAPPGGPAGAGLAVPVWTQPVAENVDRYRRTKSFSSQARSGQKVIGS